MPATTCIVMVNITIIGLIDLGNDNFIENSNEKYLMKIYTDILGYINEAQVVIHFLPFVFSRFFWQGFFCKMT